MRVKNVCIVKYTYNEYSEYNVALLLLPFVLRLELISKQYPLNVSFKKTRSNQGYLEPVLTVPLARFQSRFSRYFPNERGEQGECRDEESRFTARVTRPFSCYGYCSQTRVLFASNNKLSLIFKVNEQLWIGPRI